MGKKENCRDFASVQIRKINKEIFSHERKIAQLRERQFKLIKKNYDSVKRPKLELLIISGKIKKTKKLDSGKLRKWLSVRKSEILTGSHTCDCLFDCPIRLGYWCVECYYDILEKKHCVYVRVV